MFLVFPVKLLILRKGGGGKGLSQLSPDTSGYLGSMTVGHNEGKMRSLGILFPNQTSFEAFLCLLSLRSVNWLFHCLLYLWARSLLRSLVCFTMTLCIHLHDRINSISNLDLEAKEWREGRCGWKVLLVWFHCLVLSILMTIHTQSQIPEEIFLILALKACTSR